MPRLAEQYSRAGCSQAARRSFLCNVRNNRRSVRMSGGGSRDFQVAIVGRRSVRRGWLVSLSLSLSDLDFIPALNLFPAESLSEASKLRTQSLRSAARGQQLLGIVCRGVYQKPLARAVMRCLGARARKYSMLPRLAESEQIYSLFDVDNSK